MGKPLNSTLIHLVYTEQEWSILEQMSLLKGSKDFRSYLNNRMHRVAKGIRVDDLLIQEPEICVPCSKRDNNFFIPEDIVKQIVYLARIHCLPLSTAVRRFFSDPLIQEHVNDNIFKSEVK
jgi:hypothetical protein